MKTHTHIMEEWTEADVGNWLMKLNLKEWVSTFREHCVDGSLLLQLNDADLIELGLSSGLTRKRILLARTRDQSEPPVPAEDIYIDVASSQRMVRGEDADTYVDLASTRQSDPTYIDVASAKQSVGSSSGSGAPTDTYIDVAAAKRMARSGKSTVAGDAVPLDGDYVDIDAVRDEVHRLNMHDAPGSGFSLSALTPGPDVPLHSQRSEARRENAEYMELGQFQRPHGGNGGQEHGYTTLEQFNSEPADIQSDTYRSIEYVRAVNELVAMFPKLGQTIVENTLRINLVRL